MNDYCNHLYDNTTDGYIQILNIDQSKKINGSLINLYL